MKKELPVGIQDFKKIIEGNYLLVDKTKEIWKLINSGTCFFISRPRRFGKSLFISTLKYFFCGERELFKKLYIYKKCTKWDPHPVVVIDFAEFAFDTPAELKAELVAYCDDVASNYSIKLTKKSTAGKFLELITKISSVTNSKVVVLVDEYDRPIIDNISNATLAAEYRKILRDFYGVLKPADRFLRFVMLTGVSKFSKVSIFSGLNNLTDLTTDRKAVTLLGITKNELLDVFDQHIKSVAKALKINQQNISL